MTKPQPRRRARRHWSRLGVSRQTVNAIETGRYDPSLPLAFAVARLFDLAIEQVFAPGDEVAPALDER